MGEIMVYITGDTHGAFDIHKINPREFEAAAHLTENDYVIICGDFGCIWDGGSSDRFWLNWIESLPWNMLFIDGNHENFDVLNAYPEEEWHGGRVNRIRSNIYHLRRGEIYDIDGHTYLAMGGGFSHDISLRTEGTNWWKEEMLTEQEAENAYRNLEKHDWKVDYVLSHDTFKSHPAARTFTTDMSHYNDDQVDIQEVLQKIHDQAEYKIWFNGHYHKDMFYQEPEREQAGGKLIPKKEYYTLYDNILRLEDFKDSRDQFMPVDEKTPFTVHDFAAH